MLSQYIYFEGCGLILVLLGEEKIEKLKAEHKQYEEYINQMKNQLQQIRNKILV